MFNYFALIVALTLCVVVNGAPTSTQIMDLTGQDFSSICGTKGIFLSGKVNYVSKSECQFSSDSIACKNTFHFNFAGAKVLFDDGRWSVVTDTSNTKTSFESSSSGSTSSFRNVLSARELTPKVGLTSNFKIHIFCQTVNGVSNCKIEKVEQEC